MNLSWFKIRPFRNVPSDHLFGRPCGSCPHSAGWHRWIKAKAGGADPQISYRKTNCHKCPCTRYKDDPA